MPNLSPGPSDLGTVGRSLHGPVATDLGVVGRAAHVLEHVVRGSRRRRRRRKRCRPCARSPLSIGVRGKCHSSSMTKELVHPEWVRRLNLFGDVVGDPHLVVDLDPDELLDASRGDAPASPTSARPSGRAGTRPTGGCSRRSTTKSQLHLLGRVLTRGEVLRILQTWLRLQDAWTCAPADRAPSRSTRRCSSSVRRARARRSCSSCSRSTRSCGRRSRGRRCIRSRSARDDADDDRAAGALLAECEQEFWADIHPEFMTMHELASDLPCECVHFLAYDFAGPYWSMLYDTPSVHGLAARAPRDARRGCTACTAGCCRRSSTGSTTTSRGAGC